MIFFKIEDNVVLDTGGQITCMFQRRRKLKDGKGVLWGDHKCMTDSCIGLRIQPGKSTSSNKSVPGFRQVVQPPDTTSSYNTFEIPNSKLVFRHSFFSFSFFLMDPEGIAYWYDSVG